MKFHQLICESHFNEIPLNLSVVALLKISCHARMTFYFTFLSHYTLSLTFNIQDMRLLVMAGIMELISPAVQKIYYKKFEKYNLHK